MAFLPQENASGASRIALLGEPTMRRIAADQAQIAVDERLDAVANVAAPRAAHDVRELELRVKVPRKLQPWRRDVAKQDAQIAVVLDVLEQCALRTALHQRLPKSGMGWTGGACEADGAATGAGGGAAAEVSGAATTANGVGVATGNGLNAFGKLAISCKMIFELNCGVPRSPP